MIGTRWYNFYPSTVTPMPHSVTDGRTDKQTDR